MNKVKIYKKIGNSKLVRNSYTDFPHYNVFLDYDAKKIYKYDKQYDILKENVEKIFRDEENPNYNESFSGVLAYGEVQSGKTSNMIASLIKAYSLGFKDVFVLTGNNEVLHNQTVSRFEDDVHNFGNFLEDGMADQSIKKMIDYVDFDSFQNSNLTPKIEFINLKDRYSVVNDLDNLKKQIEIWNRQDRMNVFFVMKNVANYDKMSMIAKNLSVNTAGANGMIIFDDEADWGFEDAESSNTTELFEKITEMKMESISNNNYLKYVAFTATPYKIFKNYYQKLIFEVVFLNSKIIENWMNYEYIMKNEPFYSGARIFHNNDEKDFLTDQLLVTNDQRNIKNILNRQFVRTVPDDFNEKGLLKLSVILFLINTYIFNKNNALLKKQKKLTYGLLFPDIKKVEHNKYYEWAIEVANELKDKISKITEGEKVDFKELFLDDTTVDLNNIKKLILKKLNSVQDNTHLIDFIKQWSKLVSESPESFLVKMSGTEEKADAYLNKKIVNGVNAVFIIGGFKISRGVTFPNLMLEVITATSKQADATLQRARWFGYRSMNTLGIMNIIMTQSASESFDDSIAEDYRWRSQYGEND